MEPTTRASGPITAIVLAISAIVIGCVTSTSRSSPPVYAGPPAATRNAAIDAPSDRTPVVEVPSRESMPVEAVPEAPKEDAPSSTRIDLSRERKPATAPRLGIRGDSARSVAAGAAVTLEAAVDGADGDGVRYSWTQISGPPVLLLNRDADTLSFTAPDDLTEEAELTFQVAVAGVDDAEPQQVTVMVATAALAANAGADKSIVLGDAVYLDGAVGGGAPGYSYRWSPTTGLSNATLARPLAAPRVTTAYTLTVTDATGAISNDTATVTLAPGRVYFVAAGAVGASDANSGLEARPWKTLTKAASVAGPGDTVLVRSGTYAQTLKPLKSGTAAGRLTFKARGGDSVTLDGQNLLSTGINLSMPASYTRVEGFEVRNFTGTGVFIQAWGSQGSTNVEVVGNRIHDNKGDAISARNSANSFIENNEIYANGLTAVAIGGQYGSTNLTIRGNDIHYNGKDGVQGGGNGVVVEHNRIYDQFHTSQHQDGLDMSGIRNLTVRYNTIFDVTQPVYVHNQEGPCSGIKVYGNVFYNDRYATVRGGQSPGVFVDARFAGEGVTDVEIHSNTFGWTGYSGVRIFGAVSGVTLRNNILFESGIGIGATTVTNVSSDYNLFFKSVIPSMEGSHSRTADPQFVSYSRNASWDFHLLTTSPAIDTGDPTLGAAITLPADFHDLDRQPRPRGGTYDAGALER